MSQKSRKLLQAIGDIDDCLVEAAAPAKQKRRVQPFVRWAYGIAACVMAAVSIGILQRQFTGSISASSVQPSISSEQPDHSGIQSSGWQSSVPSSGSEPPKTPSGDLPAVTPWQAYERGGAGGGESYMMNDISELKDAMPWSEETELESLPVFHNVYASTVGWTEEQRNRRCLPLLEGKKTSVEEMEALARSIAEDLGVTVGAVRTSTDRVNELPTRVILSCSGDVVITANNTLGARIEFKTPVSLPEGYRFDDEASFEELTAAGEYLMREYADLFHMARPTLNIYGGARDSHQKQVFSCYVYEGEGDLTQRMLNYHFNTVRFSPDSEGNLWLIDFTRFDLSDKLGDYPIYTVEEAKQRLAEGKYTASGPNFPDGAEIAKVELIYRGYGEITIMPYYRFYAELPRELWEQPLNGDPMKTYGAYYVPAVREEYINRRNAD